MPGRLGVDFGTSNTVVTLWNDKDCDGTTVQLKEYTRLQDCGDNESIFIVPSLVHYADDFRYYYGDEVLQRNLGQSPRTFQWMKRYISHRSPVERNLDGRRVNYFDAGKRFLSEILSASGKYISLENEEIALTVPVESFEDYSSWLGAVVQDARIGRFRVIDEPTAAALGHGAELHPDDVYMVFDFGGGTLDVAIVLVEQTQTSGVGRYCRVLGKAGIDMGGTSIDEWLFDEVLTRNNKTDADEDVRSIGRAILSECERLKETLSFHEKADFSVMNPMTGAMVSFEITRGEFEDLLDKHEAFARMDKAIRRAMTGAFERGFSEDQIKAVLMVGGCSQIPSVQKALKRIFGNERVLLNRPLDAVARGAAAFIAGTVFNDYIQHDYAIRYVNPANGRYEYRPLVRRGTKYPSDNAVAVITVKASYDGQDKLGLPIFEIGGSASGASGEQRMEIFFDEFGVPTVHAISETERAKRNLLWINESNPTFLTSEPAAKRGEPRFRIEFSVDCNRRLLMTAQDIRTSDTVFRDYPLAKLI